MYHLTLLLLAFLANFQKDVSSTLAYEVGTEENIKSNLIRDDSDPVEGLIPPEYEAIDHYNLELKKSASDSENPYQVEITKKYIKIKTTGFPAQKIKLNQTESEGIQKLSVSIVELLNSSKLSSPTENEQETTDWEKVNPVLILTSSGISLQFLNAPEPEANAAEATAADKRVLWDFLTKYARNIFEAKLTELNLNNQFAETISSSADDQNSTNFQKFLTFLWKITKISVSYAESAYGGWTTSPPETTAPDVDKKSGSTSTLFAFEELSSYHEFPSQEFQYRRKDIDSIFYGRGII